RRRSLPPRGITRLFRFRQHRLSTERQRVYLLCFDFAAPPFLECRIDSSQHGFQRHAGILPAFNQRPIERRKQKQAGTAHALKMLFDLREVVEVVEWSFGHTRCFCSQINRRPSRVRCSSTCWTYLESRPMILAWPPVAMILVPEPSSPTSRARIP